MRLEWTFTAESYLDQLPREDRTKVLRAVEESLRDWDRPGADSLTRLTGDQKDLYVLRAGADLRVVVRREGDVLSVVDVVQRSQVDGLRRLSGGSRAASG